MRACVLPFLLLGACSPGGGDSGDLPEGWRPTNVLMLSIDTVRRDHLSRYGFETELMPFLDDLASRSLALDQHRSCANWTFPAALCGLDGRENLEEGFVAKIADEYREPAPPRENLGTYLGSEGYYTIVISGNQWFVGKYNDPGFDVQENPDHGTADRLYRDGIDALDAALADGWDRWFLHLHFVEPHDPYTPPDSYLDGLKGLPQCPFDLGTPDGWEQALSSVDDLSEKDRGVLLQHLRVRYQAELRYMDDLLQRSWADLEERGLLSDALVVVWTDHGEQFWERGALTHGNDLNYEENDAVALFWHRAIMPRAWDGPTSHIDLAPTVLDLLGLEVPEGVSGLPAGTAPDDRPLFAFAMSHDGPRQSVVSEDWMLQYTWSLGRLQLYDLAADPLQADDRFAADDPEAIRLWALLEPQVEQAIPLVPEYTAEDPGMGARSPRLTAPPGDSPPPRG